MPKLVRWACECYIILRWFPSNRHCTKLNKVAIIIVEIGLIAKNIPGFAGFAIFIVCFWSCWQDQIPHDDEWYKVWGNLPLWSTLALPWLYVPGSTIEAVVLSLSPMTQDFNSCIRNDVRTLNSMLRFRFEVVGLKTENGYAFRFYRGIV